MRFSSMWCSWLTELFYSLCSAAFLTQTVSLDEQTIVKFEIWCVGLRSEFYDPLLLTSYVRIQGHGRSGAV